MKSLTAALILFASFPSYSCPFHGAYFFGDDEYTGYPDTFTGSVKEEKPNFATERNAQVLFQFDNLDSQLKQRKQAKR